MPTTKHKTWSEVIESLPEDQRYRWEERVAIVEYGCRVPRVKAEEMVIAMIELDKQPLLFEDAWRKAHG